MIRKSALLVACLTSTLSAAPSIWNGIFTAEQAVRGKKVYDTECADCHGRNLEGVDDAAPLTGEDFLKKWDAKTVGKLIDVTKRTMPPETPGRLSRPVCTDLVAYVLSVNGFPAGNAELRSGAPELKEIVIEPKK